MSRKVHVLLLSQSPGGIIDDLFINMISEDDNMLVVNASNIERTSTGCRSTASKASTLTIVPMEMASWNCNGPESKAIHTSEIKDAQLQ